MNVKKSRNVMVVKTTFGVAGVGFAGDRIARLWLPGLERRELEARMKAWSPGAASLDNPNLADRIRRYFLGETVAFPDPVDPGASSEFARRVYRQLRKVERGETVTYGRLAARLGRPNASRAVGMIMGGNPVPLIIPCHRVVRSDGTLGGFSGPGGVALKRRMLDLERND